METLSSSQVTRLIQRWNEGEQEALDQLMPLVIDQLLDMARRRLQAERADHTLQTCALINELYLKLTGDKHLEMQNRAQFFAAAAVIMRRILIDSARRHRAVKRGGNRLPGPEALDLEEIAGSAVMDGETLLALDAVMERLRLLDPKGALVVDLKFFVGLTNLEISEILSLSERTVRREINAAKAWLKRELSR